MSTSWDSLYLPCAESEPIAAAARASLTTLGYQLYDPFGLIPGKAYPQSVRLFISPSDNGWTRIIGSPDTRMLPTLSAVGPCLWLRLDGGDATIETYLDGAQVDWQTALSPHLRPDRSSDDLTRVLEGTMPQIVESGERGNSLFDTLPDDVQPLASRLDKGQAQKMFDRLSGNLLRKASQRGGTEVDEEAARSIISGSRPDWNSPGGQRIRGLMSFLSIPANWREPDFTTLRDAYQLLARRRRNPNAQLYPGDAEAMDRVPNALDYVPVYGGQ